MLYGMLVMIMLMIALLCWINNLSNNNFLISNLNILKLIVIKNISYYYNNNYNNN